jgi:hypothetical protein
MPLISSSVKREETSVSARLPGKDVDQAIAISMAEGPAAGPALADELAADGKLASYHLLRRLGRLAEAADRPPIGCRRRPVPAGMPA